MMINQSVIVGKIIDISMVQEKDNLKYTTLSIVLPRIQKNKNGEQEFYFVNTILASGISENIIKYCKKGDLIGTWFPDRQYKGKSCILPLIYNINLTIYHNLLFVNK